MACNWGHSTGLLFSELFPFSYMISDRKRTRFYCKRAREGGRCGKGLREDQAVSQATLQEQLQQSGCDEGKIEIEIEIEIEIDR